MAFVGVLIKLASMTVGCGRLVICICGTDEESCRWTDKARDGEKAGQKRNEIERRMGWIGVGMDCGRLVGALMEVVETQT